MRKIRHVPPPYPAATASASSCWSAAEQWPLPYNFIAAARRRASAAAAAAADKACGVASEDVEEDEEESQRSRLVAAVLSTVRISRRQEEEDDAADASSKPWKAMDARSSQTEPDMASFGSSDLSTNHLEQEPAAEPNGVLYEADDGPSRYRASALGTALLPLLGRAVRRRQRSGLSQWRAAVKEEAAAGGVSLSAVEHHLVQQRVAKLIGAWRSLAAESKARNVLRRFCANYRMRWLTTRALQAFCLHATTRAVMTNRAETAFERCADALLKDGAGVIVEAWRRLAACCSLHSRREQVLTLWVRASRLRFCVREWRNVVLKIQKLHSVFASFSEYSSGSSKSRVCAAWRRVALVAEIARKHGAIASKRLVAMSWTVWSGYSRRAVRGRQASLCYAIHRARNLLRTWQRLYSAVAHLDWHLSSRSLQAMFARWRKLIARIRHALGLSACARASQLRRGLRAWSSLHVAGRLYARSCVNAAFTVWHARWLRNSRCRDCLNSSLGEWELCQRPMQKRALTWWATLTLKRKQGRHVRYAAQRRALSMWRDWTDSRIGDRGHMDRTRIVSHAFATASQLGRAKKACQQWHTWAKHSRRRKTPELRGGADGVCLHDPVASTPPRTRGDYLYSAGSHSVSSWHSDDELLECTEELGSRVGRASVTGDTGITLTPGPRNRLCDSAERTPTPLVQLQRRGFSSLGCSGHAGEQRSAPIFCKENARNVPADEVTTLPKYRPPKPARRPTSTLAWRSLTTAFDMAADARLSSNPDGFPARVPASLGAGRARLLGTIKSTSEAKLGAAKRRWVRLVAAMRLMDMERMPCLQWSFALWRGETLRTKVRRMKWSSFGMCCGLGTLHSSPSMGSPQLSDAALLRMRAAAE